MSSGESKERVFSKRHPGDGRKTCSKAEASASHIVTFISPTIVQEALLVQILKHIQLLF